MLNNFTYSEWEKICRIISDQFSCIRVVDILSQPDSANWVAVKHDVEVSVGKALRFARIENRYGIRATYFFQADLLPRSAGAISEIAKMGHEIAYHYDVLDSSKGDMEVAAKDFSKNLRLFEKIGFSVKTVCPHGNPLMERDGWKSNKDFFRSDLVKEKFPGIFDVIVNGEEIIVNGHGYVSDAGYAWKEIKSICDNDTVPGEDVPLEGTAGLLRCVQSHPRIIISSHPHRWSRSALRARLKVFIFVVAKKSALYLSRNRVFHRIFSRYYYLARRI